MQPYPTAVAVCNHTAVAVRAVHSLHAATASRLARVRDGRELWRQRWRRELYSSHSHRETALVTPNSSISVTGTGDTYGGTTGLFGFFAVFMSFVAGFLAAFMIGSLGLCAVFFAFFMGLAWRTTAFLTVLAMAVADGPAVAGMGPL